MGLLDALHAGIAVANTITRPLQTSVSYERCTGTNSDGYGGKSYASAVTMLALVDWTAKSLRTQAGDLTVCRVSITLLDVAAIAVVTGGVGIDDSDRFTLPDGTTGPILDLRGFLDAGTGQPLATEVMLG